jgi:hypothetical protein
MWHLKCLTCRTRLYSTEGDPIGDLCPVCGSPLAALRAPATMSMAIGHYPCTATGSPRPPPLFSPLVAMSSPDDAKIASGAARRRLTLRPRPLFGCRDEMGSTPGHEDDEASDGGPCSRQVVL